MNTLYTKLNDDIKSAMRSKDAERLSTLRMLKTALTNELVKMGVPPTSEIDDNLFQSVVVREIKQRNELVKQFESAGRNDLADKTKFEISVLSEYAPDEATEDEIRTFIKNFIDNNQESNMGAIIKATMEHFGARADGKTVSQIVRELM